MSLTTTTQDSRKSDVTSMDFRDTELTLCLPGGGVMRGFVEIVRVATGPPPEASKRSDSELSDASKPSAAKAQVVGWPPVRSMRKKVVERCCKYVKVAVDGAPYLRKVDLELYQSYQDLLIALEQMFICFTIIHCDNSEQNKFVDPVNGTEFVPTYEDKDGDWMLVGDVPWKMFKDSCKRIRFMKSPEAVGFAPGTPPRCTS